MAKFTKYLVRDGDTFTGSLKDITLRISEQDEGFILSGTKDGLERPSHLFKDKYDADYTINKLLEENIIVKDGE